MAKSQKKEVAKPSAGGLVAGDINDEALLDDAEAGSHGFKREDLTLPFIRVLQKLSPQLDKSESEYIENAEEGDFINTATKEVYNGGNGLHFVPVVYTINYTEWTPREQGGGLIADHGTDKGCLIGTKREKGKEMTPRGTIIVTSGLYFGFLVNLVTGDVEQAIVPMASTQLKKSRSLNSVIQNFRHAVATKDGPRRINPRMWFHLLKITTIPESNDQGKWMGLKVERIGSVLEHEWGHKAYQAGRDLAELFEKGELKMRAEQLGGESESGDGGGSSAGGPAPARTGAGGKEDEDIPF